MRFAGVNTARSQSVVPASRQPGGRNLLLQSSCPEQRPCKRRQGIKTFAGETITDQSVPEGHKGLHGFLYGDGGAEAHGDNDEGLDMPTKVAFHHLHNGPGTELDGQRVAAQMYIDKRFGVKKAGVYAVVDANSEYQYISFTRSLHLALEAHMAAVGPERCSFVEIRALPPNTVANRARMQAETDKWLSELDSPPPGNAHQRNLWEAKAVTDKETFEEKKLKLQRAMGEKLDSASLDPSAEQRRQDLIAAISQDDWSSVIDAQTQETVAPASPSSQPSAASQADPGTFSPFSAAEVQEDIGRNGQAQPMTPESVDQALEEVRPYLIADGGNVEVADVSDGVVSLRLQGACGTCASSSSTMKLGIERSLRAAFGDALKEVRQVDAKDTSATVSSVDSHLDMLRPAINSYGGSVKVMEIGGGKCTLQYNGPPTIRMGITAAIKNQFPDIAEVIIT